MRRAIVMTHLCASLTVYGDLAYGDESHNNDLKAMVESDDPAYREIFERCYWRPTEEERRREREAEEPQQIEAVKLSPRRRGRSGKQPG